MRSKRKLWLTIQSCAFLEFSFKRLSYVKIILFLELSIWVYPASDLIEITSSCHDCRCSACTATCESLPLIAHTKCVPARACVCTNSSNIWPQLIAIKLERLRSKVKCHRQRPSQNLSSYVAVSEYTIPKP